MNVREFSDPVQITSKYYHKFECGHPMRNIYFFYSELKDEYCLSPLAKEMSADSEWQIHQVNPLAQLCADNPKTLLQFCSEINPVVIVATLTALNLAKFIHPGKIISIGLDHGFAPFKSYSYAPHFSEFDRYLAPSQFMLDRLQNLYPSQASHFGLGGYPRIEDLKNKLAQRAPKRSKIRKQYLSDSVTDSIKLVVLSWGLNLETYAALPDRSDIIYLLHPAEVDEIVLHPWVSARSFRSTPDIASDLICIADIIFGDLSSLTLEAIALKKSTLMILDERLYRKDYDVDLEFLTRTSKNYLKIPASGYYISKDEIINLVELQILLAHRLTDVKIHEYSDALVRSGQEPRMFMWTRFESQIFPPQGDNRQFAIAAITSTIASLADADDSVFREDASHREDFLSDLGFITFAYRNILNRDPDLDGMHFICRSVGPRREEW